MESLALLAVIALGAQHIANRRALDRAAQQLDAVLDRISTEPRLELRPAATAPQPSAERTYFADHVGDDAAWNEYRGEPAEEDDE